MASEMDEETAPICVFQEKPTYYVMCHKVLSYFKWTDEDSADHVGSIVDQLLSMNDAEAALGMCIYSTHGISLNIVDMVE